MLFIISPTLRGDMMSPQAFLCSGPDPRDRWPSQLTRDDSAHLL